MTCPPPLSAASNWLHSCPSASLLLLLVAFYSTRSPLFHTRMARCSGEYAERIDNADELLESFLESFDDETPQVQLQMLTATVKLFLKRPAETQKMVQDVLTLATQDSDNPDLRDRGYIYWRLLSTDPEAAKKVKPSCRNSSQVLPNLLTHLHTCRWYWPRNPISRTTLSLSTPLCSTSSSPTSPRLPRSITSHHPRLSPAVHALVIHLSSSPPALLHFSSAMMDKPCH